MRFRNTLPLLVLVAIGAFAQQAKQAASTSPEPLSTSMATCVTSGSGPNYMKLCISRHGNLVSLQSPSGKEHLRLGEITEGYTVCHYEPINAGSPTEYFDFSSSEYGWQEPYKVVQPGGANTLPLTIYRKSTDGKVELVPNSSRNTVELEVTLTMTVYNRSNSTLRALGILRSVDFDANNTPGNDVFLSTQKSVIAWDEWFQSGLSVTASGRKPMPRSTHTQCGRTKAGAFANHPSTLSLHFRQLLRETMSESFNTTIGARSTIFRPARPARCRLSTESNS